jgi:hypothetical protein
VEAKATIIGFKEKERLEKCKQRKVWGRRDTEFILNPRKSSFCSKVPRQHPLSLLIRTE